MTSRQKGSLALAAIFALIAVAFLYGPELDELRYWYGSTTRWKMLLVFSTIAFTALIVYAVAKLAEDP